MLLLITVYCVLFFTRPKQAFIPNVSYKIRDFCTDDSGVSPEMAQRLQEDPQKELIDLESCYINCVYIETGFLSESGDIVVEKLKEELPGVNVICLKQLKRIEKCEDMAKLKTCYV